MIHFKISAGNGERLYISSLFNIFPRYLLHKDRYARHVRKLSSFFMHFAVWNIYPRNSDSQTIGLVDNVQTVLGLVLAFSTMTELNFGKFMTTGFSIVCTIHIFLKQAKATLCIGCFPYVFFYKDRYC